MANDKIQIDQFIGQLPPTGRYVFLNGQYAPEFSSLPSFFSPTQGGALITLPVGVVVEEPIFLVFVVSPNGGAHPEGVHIKNRVVANDQSQATIVESYIGWDSASTSTESSTELMVGQRAIIHHVKVQQESEKASHTALLDVTQDRQSTFASHSFSLGGAMVQNTIHTLFTAEGGECILDGLFAVAGEQRVANYTQIDHAKPHCSSRELYKGVLGGRARGVFNGKIVVRPNAQKTDAKQTNKNLLLSKEALINTTPQLEIRADDVKCTNGSTIGQLDEQALFYLRARGIEPENARQILTYAFAKEMVDRVGVKSLQNYLEGVVTTALLKCLT